MEQSYILNVNFLEDPEKFHEFLLACSLDFGIFFTKLLGFDYNWHHQEIISSIQTHRKTVWIAPRGHGKTTLILSYILWLVFFNKNLDILVVSNSHRQSMELMDTLRAIMEDNKLLKNLIPKSLDQTSRYTKLSWSRTQIITTTKCKIASKANNENIRGGQHDFALCDEGGQYDDKSNFYGVVQPTVEAKDGRIVVIGTPQSKIDLLNELLREESFYYGKTYRALEGNQPLWEYKFPVKKLAEIRASMPAHEWEREYMCNPIGDEFSLFPFKLICKGFDKEAKFRYHGDPTKRYYMGVDFALSTGSGADYSVFTVIELDANNNKRIVRIERNKGEDFETQYQRLRRLYENFRIQKIMIDEGSMGLAFFDRMKSEGMVVEGYKFQGDKRYQLLSRLRNQFENNKIIIPRYKDTETVNITDILIEELMQMGVTYTEKTKQIKWDTAGKHDDCVISLGLSIEACGTSFGKVTITFI